ncbi:MAG: NTP/NDP exchange transporter [Puniceicoccales bacterium]|jgi:AAA family ATP:ADP antiporter|nr:NTP/NDP exchange transporter [Puniceicoccales bacterium]
MANIIQGNGQEFGKLRRIFFPLYVYELKKAIPMGFMFFCILFNYTCLRNIKDSLIVTGPGSDAEVIPFLKGYCVAPAAILFLLLYAKASNIFTNEHLFYVTLTPFILFFGCFAFFIYPSLSVLHFSPETIACWREAAPKFLHWPIAIIGNWSYSLFYILAEIWGSALLSLSFWQFANQITKTSEAKRMYAFFAFMAQLSVLLEGKVGEWCSDIRAKVPVGVDAWEVSLKYMMGIVVVLGIVAMCIYRWIYRYVLTDKRFYDKPELPGNTGGKGKKKIPLLQSFKIIFTSPYLGLIVALVVCYGISVNLVEGLWKKQLGMQYSDPNAYNTFMNRYTFYGGIASMVMLIIGGNILRICRWFTAAIATPVMLLLLGSSFFVFVLFRENLVALLQSLSTTPLFCAVILGALVVAISKAVKYALFDLTKEMAYIPLDEDMKVKGKAVVEVVGGRFGKAGGAWIQSLLLLIPGANYFIIAPYTFTIFIGICALWMLSVKALSHRVEAITEKASN